MKIELTDGNIKRGHFYIQREPPILPSDAWGGNNIHTRAETVVFEFSGTGERVKTDIASDKRIPRNARGECSRFFSHHGLGAGDYIKIEKMGPRHFRVSPVAQSSEQTPTKHVVPVGSATPDRSESVVQRITRDSNVIRHIKKLYAYRCQICNVAIKTRRGPYAEGAHIRPLGSPHNGPDVLGNVLCLCPNHHVMLDGGTLTINDDLSLNGVTGLLFVHPSHNIEIEHIRHQRISAKNIAPAGRYSSTRDADV